ncbi:MAG: hypothetical protein AABZ00_01300 [Chloroflexota bacterium]|jgi:hypothetical protein
MNTEPMDEPGKKMRKLLGSSSPLMRLPKKNTNIKEDEGAEAPPKQDNAPPASQPTKIKPASSPKPKTDPVAKGRIRLFGPPLWNIASILSLSVNVILIIVLLALAISLNSIGLSITSMLNMGTDLLGGLYGNFEKMDRAHITTDIKVETTIPVKFDLQLNQQTNVVLSQDVTINNALVTVNTGGLNIARANTTIVLPSGTTLPVFLNLTVPVDTTVPVVLNVPVDIPLEGTQLHEPFAGLQEVVRPFYCMINANAVNLNGEPICK